MRDVFELVGNTDVDKNDSYILSYPHILEYFSDCKEITAPGLVCGAHMVYGWMPTILTLHPTEERCLQCGATLLNKARSRMLTDDEIESLAGLVNKSIVGASKLLHFVAPRRFAIWDSRIYCFLHDKTPSPTDHYHANKVKSYREYLKMLKKIRERPRFAEFRKAVTKKVGYKVSGLRAIELIMFLNVREPNSEK